MGKEYYIYRNCGRILIMCNIKGMYVKYVGDVLLFFDDLKFSSWILLIFFWEVIIMVFIIIFEYRDLFKGVC